jgi:hypothetical protein
MDLLKLLSFRKRERAWADTHLSEADTVLMTDEAALAELVPPAGWGHTTDPLTPAPDATR